MKEARTIFWCICFAFVLDSFARAEDDAKGMNETLQFDISRGITLYVANDKASITLRMSSLLRGDEVEQRGNTGRLKFKKIKGVLQKIGMAMMMAPLMMQLVSLPATLASIKISLLRSIMMGKLALAVLLYNVYRNSQKSEVVLVHKPEYHEHHYPGFHRPEDDDAGWLGR